MPEAGRAVISDDGLTIRLTAYGGNGAVVPVALDPVRAIVVAGELIRAAVPKLANLLVEEFSMASAPKSQKQGRGGDRLAGQRQQRDDDIRALATLMGGGNP